MVLVADKWKIIRKSYNFLKYHLVLFRARNTTNASTTWYFQEIIRRSYNFLESTKSFNRVPRSTRNSRTTRIFNLARYSIFAVPQHVLFGFKTSTLSRYLHSNKAVNSLKSRIETPRTPGPFFTQENPVFIIYFPNILENILCMIIKHEYFYSLKQILG